jgi:hypothetical protein
MRKVLKNGTKYNKVIRKRKIDSQSSKSTKRMKIKIRLWIYYSNYAKEHLPEMMQPLERLEEVLKKRVRSEKNLEKK